MTPGKGSVRGQVLASRKHHLLNKKVKWSFNETSHEMCKILISSFRGRELIWNKNMDSTSKFPKRKPKTWPELI